MCENRCVLFDNKTKDKGKQFGQVQQLLTLVSMVISQNDGRPYTDELFIELKVKVLQILAMFFLKSWEDNLYDVTEFITLLTAGWSNEAA